MANLGGTFDASQVDPSQPQELLPPGDYRVQIINSEMRVTKTGTGQYLWLEMDVLDGALAGRKVYDRLNLINPNSQAVEISQRTLSAICHALGRMQVKDSEELHFQPVLVKVTVGKSGYNEVKGYRPIGGSPPPATPQVVPTNQGFQQPAQQTQAPNQGYQQPVQQAVPQNQGYQQPMQHAVPQNQGYQQPAQPTPVPNQGFQQPTQQDPTQGVQQPMQQTTKPNQGYQQPAQRAAPQQPQTTPPPVTGGNGPWRRMG